MERNKGISFFNTKDKLNKHWHDQGGNKEVVVENPFLLERPVSFDSSLIASDGKFVNWEIVWDEWWRTGLEWSAPFFLHSSFIVEFWREILTENNVARFPPLPFPSLSMWKSIRNIQSCFNCAACYSFLLFSLSQILNKSWRIKVLLLKITQFINLTKKNFRTTFLLDASPLDQSFWNIVLVPDDRPEKFVIKLQLITYRGFQSIIYLLQLLFSKTILGSSSKLYQE